MPNPDKKPELERRVLGGEIELRADGDNPPVIVGYGAVFNRLSEPMYGFREQIAPGAFDGVLDNDVRALWNHDENQLLGRTTSGTLRLSVDAVGLRYEIDPPETGYATDLITSMRRGDTTQSSFGFTVQEDDWEDRKDGMTVRTIIKVRRLYDVSPVTFPAYPDASAAMRSMTAWREHIDEVRAAKARLDAEHRRRRLRLAEIS